MTSSHGESFSFDLADPQTGCDPIGAVWWLDENPHISDGIEDLGMLPFTFEVEVTLDGVAHTASGEIPESDLDDPTISLEFSPALK